MQVIDIQKLNLRAAEENISGESLLCRFIEDGKQRVSALQSIVLTDGTTLQAEAVLGELLTSVSSVGAERLSLVGRRVSLAFQEGQAGRAALLLNQLGWELDSIESTLSDFQQNRVAA